MPLNMVSGLVFSFSLFSLQLNAFVSLVFLCYICMYECMNVCIEISYYQEFYSNRISSSLELFRTRVFSRSVHLGQTTLNSDVMKLYNIYQLLELKSPKIQQQLKKIVPKYNAAVLN